MAFLCAVLYCKTWKLKVHTSVNCKSFEPPSKYLVGSFNTSALLTCAQLSLTARQVGQVNTSITDCWARAFPKYQDPFKMPLRYEQDIAIRNSRVKQGRSGYLYPFYSKSLQTQCYIYHFFNLLHTIFFSPKALAYLTTLGIKFISYLRKNAFLQTKNNADLNFE